MSEDIKNSIAINTSKLLEEAEKSLCLALAKDLDIAKKTLELIAQDPFNGRDGEPDPMNVILRMRVEALNALEKLK